MTKILAIILALAALGGGAYWYSHRQAPTTASSGPVVKYQCSMHPQIVRDEPGDCPICHMRLEKVLLDSSHDHAHAADSADSHGGAAQAERRILKYRHPMNPKVFSDKPMKDEMGMDFVPVYADDGARAAESAPEGRAGFNLSEYRRQLIGVRSEEAAVRDVFKTLRLPGRIGEERNRVMAQALEMDGASLRKGLQAEIRVSGEEPRRAVVTGVDESLDAYSRTFGVYLTLTQEPAPGMRSGVYCDARIRLKLGNGLSVPKEAVLDTGERQLVYVQKGDRFEPREIIVGREGDEYVEVRKGLKEGERVVSSANFLIDSESRFKSAAAQY